MTTSWKHVAVRVDSYIEQAEYAIDHQNHYIR